MSVGKTKALTKEFKKHKSIKSINENIQKRKYKACLTTVFMPQKITGCKLRRSCSYVVQNNVCSACS